MGAFQIAIIRHMYYVFVIIRFYISLTLIVHIFFPQKKPYCLVDDYSRVFSGDPLKLFHEPSPTALLVPSQKNGVNLYFWQKHSLSGGYKKQTCTPTKRLRNESEEQQNERETSRLCNKKARRKRYDACSELTGVLTFELVSKPGRESSEAPAGGTPHP